MIRPPRTLIAGILATTILVTIIALVQRRPQCADFAPDRIAYLEKAGWEAYYDRDWPRVLMLMVQMNRTQFCMSWLDATLAALDIVRAAAAFAPIDNDVAAATQHLTDFYAKARPAATLRTDPATLAALEMKYWVVHRELAMARQAAPHHDGDLTPMVAALENLHNALFDAPAAAIHRSAERRAQAAATVDRITGGYSDNVAADWQAIEQLLQEAYRAVSPASLASE
ncbi:MAG TPA: hypothetical protein DCL15_02880 [Chloroflexi bacterium]|nr:hypothetical protein [Chloroflexota bacterium]HHW87833.1 hypothetical protein [Chloroflexota bacterium]